MTDTTATSRARPDLAGLVESRMAALGLGRHALVTRWGYANAGRGLRRLQGLLDGSFDPNQVMLGRLAVALDIPEAEAMAALAEMRARRAQAQEAACVADWDEWCRTFRPHAILDPLSEQPAQIFPIIWCGGATRLLRREIDTARPVIDWPRQIGARLPDGVPGFGWIKGFIINYAPDKAVRFDRAGEPVTHLSRAVRLGEARLMIGSNPNASLLDTVLVMGDLGRGKA